MFYELKAEEIKTIVDLIDRFYKSRE